MSSSRLKELAASWVYTEVISVLKNAYRIAAVVLTRMCDDLNGMEVKEQKFQVRKAWRNTQKAACMVCC